MQNTAWFSASSPSAARPAWSTTRPTQRQLSPSPPSSSTSRAGIPRNSEQEPSISPDPNVGLPLDNTPRAEQEGRRGCREEQTATKRAGQTPKRHTLKRKRDANGSEPSTSDCEENAHILERDTPMREGAAASRLNHTALPAPVVEIPDSENEESPRHATPPSVIEIPDSEDEESPRPPPHPSHFNVAGRGEPDQPLFSGSCRPERQSALQQIPQNSQEPQIQPKIQHAEVDDLEERLSSKKETINSGLSLCPEQEELVRLILNGRNVFFTGSAGCGKSTVLKAAVKKLQARGLRVRVVAPTGRAALQVDGRTTWSYMGWSPDTHKLPIEKVIDKGFRKHIKKRIRKTDVLIFDEISMVENHHFERINRSMKAVRRWKGDAVGPFGGVQVIATGDFCQLPPVEPFKHCIECGKEMRLDRTTDEHFCPKGHGPFPDLDKWAFRSDAWEECDFAHVELKEIHRQNDAEFIGMLQKCRLGVPLAPSEKETLIDHPCNVHKATQLFPTRDEVAEVNQREFNSLPQPRLTYQAVDYYYWLRDRYPYLGFYGARKEDGSLRALSEHKLAYDLELKGGMLVVLLINLDLDAGLCNGSQGIICGFETYRDVETVAKAHDPTSGPGSLNGSQIREFAGKNLAKVKQRNAQEPLLVPKVRFHNGQKRTIFPECIVNAVGDDEPYNYLCRTQIPLAAAWALSIHKSQGMTLDRVMVDLTRAFEEGQVYVALSRATGLEGLKLMGDGKGLDIGLGGNEEVQEFLREKFGWRLPETSQSSLA